MVSFNWQSYTGDLPDTATSWAVAAAVSPRARGFDTSRWNHPGEQPIDFQVAYDAGYSFWAGRLSVGDYYIDPWIERDYAAASLTPIRKIVYHVPRASLPAASQLAKMSEGLRLLPTRPDAIVMDVETDAELGAAAVTKCLKDHVWSLRQWYTGKLILYTNLNYLTHYITDTCGLDIWIAWPSTGDISPLDEWVMWQKSFAYEIPGHPDKTVDLDVFNGDEAAMLAYFGVLPPEPEPEPEPEPIPEDEMNLAYISEQLGVIQVAIQNIRAELMDVTPEPPAPPEPPEPPAPVVTATYQVTALDKAIAYFVSGMNKAEPPGPYPIMEQIPTAERTGQPFKNLPGQTVKVVRARVNADGSWDFWEIYGVLRVGTKERLYLSNADGKLID